MQTTDIQRRLLRRWRVVVGCVLAVLAVAVVRTYSAEPVYTARTQLYISSQVAALNATADPAAVLTASQLSRIRVSAYVDMVSAPRVGELIRERARVDLSAEAVAGRISASSDGQTPLIAVEVADTDPRRALQIAAGVGAAFSRFVTEIEQPSTGGASPVKVSVIRPPALPTAATSPRPTYNIALGLTIGLALGLALALLRDLLDRKVRSVDDVESLLEAPLLGTVARDPDMQTRPLVVHAAPASSQAEAFRQIRTNLQFVDVDRPLRSVVVTSSVPGEGKSTTACNIAIALAQAGVRVCLVEGDLRRPRLAQYLGVEGAAGLTTVLLGRAALDEALQSWGDGSLEVLPSGPLPPNPSELLGSGAMKELLRELEDRFDLVLIDAPPLLPVTDAAVLGAAATGVLLLVRAGTTRRDGLQQAVRTLQSVDATVLGAILNDVPTRGPDAYGYGHKYSGGGHQYVGEGPSPSASSLQWSRREDRRPQAAATHEPATADRPTPPAAPATAVVGGPLTATREPPSAEPPTTEPPTTEPPTTEPPTTEPPTTEPPATAPTLTDRSPADLVARGPAAPPDVEAAAAPTSTPWGGLFQVDSPAEPPREDADPSDGPRPRL